MGGLATGALRQSVIAERGHAEPAFLLTNLLKRSAAKLIRRYAQRMLIVNNLADGIDFFDMDALSSAMAMKVNLDLQLTPMASSLYRFLGAHLSHGNQRAKSRHIFKDFGTNLFRDTGFFEEIEEQSQCSSANPRPWGLCAACRRKRRSCPNALPAQATPLRGYSRTSL